MKPGVYSAPSAGGGGQPTITTTTDELGSDVTMTSANTWYDGPSHALAAGTYLIIANALILPSGTFHGQSMRIWDGTTVYAQIGEETTAQQQTLFSLAKVVVLAGSATVKLSVASTGAGDTLKAADALQTGGGNTATRLTTLKLA